MSKRYEELDSLRGMAAMAVFLGHIYGMFHETIIAKFVLRYGILRSLIASGEAVILFFVLSGFVLSLPFYKGKDFIYSTYIIKRICRIYIPYIFAVLIATISMVLFYTGEIGKLTDWFNTLWNGELSWKSISDHMLLLGTFSSNVDSVVWSLIHEMRISLFFPIIVFVIIKLKWKKGLLLAFSASVSSLILYMMLQPSYQIADWYSSLHYSAMFIVGAIVAKYRVELLAKISDLGSKNKLMLFMFGFVMYIYARPSYIVGRLIQLDSFSKMLIDTWFIAIGACVLILFALSSSKFGSMLKNKYMIFLGKVSYSLYLIHLPVLLSCIHLLSSVLPIWSICLISIPLVLVLSNIMYIFIEKPSMNLGKKLAVKFGNKERFNEGKAKINLQ